MQRYNAFFKNPLLLLLCNLSISMGIALYLHSFGVAPKNIFPANLLPRECSSGSILPLLSRFKSIAMKPTRPLKETSLRVLESRMKRAVRPKDRLWAMIRLAERLAGYGVIQTERAILLYMESEHLAQSIGDKRGIASAIRGAGYCQLIFFNPSAALRSFERALPIAEETGFAECEVLVLRDMGNVYRTQSRQDLALETLAKCAELAELIGNTRVQASALEQIGTTLKDLGRYQESLEYYTKSLAFFERIGSTSTGAAPIQRATTTPPRPSPFAKGRGTSLQNDRAGILLSMSDTLRHLGKYTEALSVLDRSCELRPDDANKGMCLNNRGIIYSEIGDYPNALSSFFASAKLMDLTGNTLGLANAYVNIMSVYLQLRNAEQGKDFGDKAFAIFEKIGDKHSQAAMFGVLGEYALHRGEKARSRRLLKQCLALSREIGSKDYEAEALAVLAKLEIDCGMFITGEKLYRKALAVATEIGDRDRIVTVLLGLGGLFNTLGQPEQALPLLERAIIVAEEIHARHHEQAAHQMLAETLEAKGDWARATHHLKLAFHIKEEILGTKKQKAITELQLQSDIEKSEAENVLLKKGIEYKSQEIELITMALAEKMELLRSARRQIKKIIKLLSNDKRLEFVEFLSEIERDYIPKGTRILSNEFQLLHRDILQKLSDRYPTFTFSERKICALLHEGLSTKQISLLLKLSPHTIEMSRFGIRKKMKLTRAMNLSAVLARM